MSAATLYRPYARNAHGDPVNSDGKVVRVRDAENIGTINGVVLGGPSWRPADGGTVDTTGLVGVPVSELVQPEHGDLLVVDGIRYTVHGPPQWATRGLVPTPPRFRWWSIAARSN